MSSHDRSSDPICTVDPYDYLKLERNPDGTVTRHFYVPDIPADEHSSHVRTKDVTLDPTQDTWIRIFVPTVAFAPDSPKVKRPVVIYFHGGGFILLSASSSLSHDFCVEMAAVLDAVVVSVEYRLAPEHRLPAAYEDAAHALRWASSCDEAWLKDFADLSKCFLMGTSAGGNMCYHVGMRAAAGQDELAPMKIRGLVLHHPFFGGVRRTASEVRLVDEPMFPLSVNDLLWELALPIRASRDHEYCNPTVGGYEWEAIGRSGVRVLVVGCDGDPMIDRQVELAAMLKKKGVEAVGEFKEGGFHGHEFMDLAAAKPMFDLLKDFLKCD